MHAYAAEDQTMNVQLYYIDMIYIKKDIIWEIEIQENAHAAIHHRTINQISKFS